MMKLFQATPKSGFDALPLAPLSAGDLIDLAVRIYRRQPLPLIRIVLVPGIVSYTGVILFAIGFSNFSTMRGNERVLIAGALVTGGTALYLGGKLLFCILLGGASRSLFNHILGSSGTATVDDHPFRPREVYRAVRGRVGALVGSILLLLLLGLFAATILYLILALLVVGYVTIHITFLKALPLAIQIISGGLFGLLLLSSLIWCGLIFLSRFVCLPQILLVEGRGVLGSIGRSFTLCGGQVRSMAAILLFWFFAGWSIWALLVLPLAWYGFLEGLEINPFNPQGPLWYLITQQALSQMSEILVAPVAMVGFSLLYLDTRIRKEGFDVEVLARRILSPPAHDAGYRLEMSDR